MPSPSDFRKAFGLGVDQLLGAQWRITSSSFGHDVKVGWVGERGLGRGLAAGLACPAALPSPVPTPQELLLHELRLNLSGAKRAV